MYFHARLPVSRSSVEPTDLPESFDWRNKSVITPVRDIAHAPIVAQGAAVGE